MSSQIPPVPPGVRVIGGDLDGEVAKMAEIRDWLAATKAPFTHQEFTQAFYQAFYDLCKKAWDDDRKRVAVTLPEGVFPGLGFLRNPITAESVEVRRVPMFEVVPGD